MKYTLKDECLALDALELLAPGSSKTTRRSWLKEGRVLVDGKPEKLGNLPLKSGQVIELGQKKKYTDEGVRIIYEDSHYVVVEKPAGMLSVSTVFEKGKTVHAYLKNHYRPKRVYVVHRLDQEASGVMVFALSEDGRDKIKKLFEKHDLTREYTAIVEGKMPLVAQGSWESLLYEDQRYHVHETDDPEKGQIAITHYKIMGSTNKFTQLKLTLETGRKNQIRVHCQNAGFPIVGDEKYGAVTDPIQRLCLHAHLLAFVHPITKKSMRFVSPIPNHFNQIMPLHETP